MWMECREGERKETEMQEGGRRQDEEKERQSPTRER